ncbi:MAG: OmpA family protein [Pseudomonadota bacterium]
MRPAHALAVFALITPATVVATPVELPDAARLTAADEVDGTAYRLPVAPWQTGRVEEILAEGIVRREAYVLPDTSLTPLQLIEPIRGELVEAGYSVLFECADAACGGFDFRFALDLLPEPDMHVDLGNYYYLVAEAQIEQIALVASRGATDGFLHITRIGQSAAERGAPARPSFALPLAEATPNQSIEQALDVTGGALLGDLVFQTGSSELDTGPFPSLTELAAYLNENPGSEVVLVGHTDAEGALDQNIALSQRRAEAVRQRLIAAHGIAPGRLRAEGVGYLVPRASNQTEDGRAANRRVEVIKTITE